MSNALAIAAVTAVLRDLLNNGVIRHDVGSAVGEVTISIGPPDRVLVESAPNEPTQLNLFMYMVTPNQGWRNADLPSRDGRGERTSNPPLALDLHYMLTAYGSQPFQAEILLGFAMQLFHETPVLSRSAIRAALAPAAPVNGSILPPAFATLSAADLAEQVEQIRITPQYLNTEELSKLWTSFLTQYRPTVGYQVSVVLIEPQVSARSPLPVRERRLQVLTFRHAVIEKISPQFALPGGKITIQGQSLGGKPKVNFGVASVDPDSVTDSEIQVTLPAGLRAGVNTLQLVYGIDFGTPVEPHRGFESNVAAFVVQPVITKDGGGNYRITVAGPAADANGFRSGNISVTLDPPVVKTQRVVVLLNELNPPTARPARAYSFNAPVRTGPPPANNEATDATLTIPFVNVRTGDYLARVQVDGAVSPLDADASGRFATPKVTI